MWLAAIKKKKKIPAIYPPPVKVLHCNHKLSLEQDEMFIGLACMREEKYA